jgi:hypothetical protein
MSIDALIKAREAAGMLFPLSLRAPGATPKRAMFISEALNGVLNSPEGDEAWERRVAELQADLEYFVEGRAIDPKYMFLLYHSREAVWEIRSVREQPSIRVLGRFADTDVFVATNYALREDLGGWETRAWRDVKVMARTVWNNLFHPYQPKTSLQISNLVSGALNGQYFRNPPSAR